MVHGRVVLKFVGLRNSRDWLHFRFRRENLAGYISGINTPVNIKFVASAEALDAYGHEFRKWGFAPKFCPQRGSKFQIGPHCRPPSGQIYSHTPIAPSAFGRSLDSLTNLIIHVV